MKRILKTPTKLHDEQETWNEFRLINQGKGKMPKQLPNSQQLMLGYKMHL